MAQPATLTRNLRAEFTDLTREAHAYLAALMVDHLAATDPERFAQLLDEAVAVTK